MKPKILLSYIIIFALLFSGCAQGSMEASTTQPATSQDPVYAPTDPTVSPSEPAPQPTDPPAPDPKLDVTPKADYEGIYSFFDDRITSYSHSYEEIYRMWEHHTPTLGEVYIDGNLLENIAEYPEDTLIWVEINTIWTIHAMYGPYQKDSEPHNDPELKKYYEELLIQRLSDAGYFVGRVGAVNYNYILLIISIRNLKKLDCGDDLCIQISFPQYIPIY